MTNLTRPNWVDYRRWKRVETLGLEEIQFLLGTKDPRCCDWSKNFTSAMLFNRRIRHAQWPFDADMEEYVRCKARRFVDDEKARLRGERRRAPESLDTVDGQGNLVPREIPDRKPGPEELAMMADLLHYVLLELDMESPKARYAYLQHVIKGRRFTELAAETDQSADDLRHLFARIIKRLRNYMDGVGFSEEEICDLLNNLDRLRTV